MTLEGGNVLDYKIMEKEAFRRYEMEHDGVKPDDETIMEATNISRKMLEDIYAYSSDAVSLESEVISSSEGDEVTLLDYISAPGKQLDENVIQNELNDLLRQIILEETNGSQRNYNVVIDYFGLNGEEPMSVRALSESYEVSYERIKQVLTMVVSRLQKPRNMKMLEPYMVS